MLVTIPPYPLVWDRPRFPLGRASRKPSISGFIRNQPIGVGGQFWGVTFSGFVDKSPSQSNVGAGGPHCRGFTNVIAPLPKSVPANRAAPANVALSNRASPENVAPPNMAAPENVVPSDQASPENVALSNQASPENVEALT